MTFVPFTNTALAVVRYTTSAAEEFSNTLWFDKAGFTTTDQQDLADLLDIGWATSLKTLQSSYVTYVETVVYDMRSETAPIKVANSASGAGALGEDPAPLHTALVYTLYTDQRGRSGRGRLFLCGFIENSFTGGLWNSTVVTTINPWMQDIEDDAAAGGWTWVVASRNTNGAPRTTGVTNAVTSWSVRSLKPGTQRRRLDRP